MASYWGRPSWTFEKSSFKMRPEGGGEVAAKVSVLRWPGCVSFCGVGGDRDTYIKSGEISRARGTH